MRKTANVQYDIEYHIVWTTKYRVLENKIIEKARTLIRPECNSIDVTIIKEYIEKGQDEYNENFKIIR